jgi:hypothetical protein
MTSQPKAGYNWRLPRRKLDLMENPKQLEQDVTTLFNRIENEFPGVAEGMRVLNMSYADYLTILQSAQPATSFSTNGSVVTHRR